MPSTLREIFYAARFSTLARRLPETLLILWSKCVFHTLCVRFPKMRFRSQSQSWPMLCFALLCVSLRRVVRIGLPARNFLLVPCPHCSCMVRKLAQGFLGLVLLELPPPPEHHGSGLRRYHADSSVEVVKAHVHTTVMNSYGRTLRR